MCLNCPDPVLNYRVFFSYEIFGKLCTHRITCEFFENWKILVRSWNDLIMTLNCLVPTMNRCVKFSRKESLFSDLVACIYFTGNGNDYRDFMIIYK